MVIIVAAHCVPMADACALGRVVETPDFGSTAAELDKRPGLVVTPASFGHGSSVSGLRIAEMARARRIPCIIVDRHATEDVYGAACMRPGDSLVEAVGRARALR